MPKLFISSLICFLFCSSAAFSQTIIRIYEKPKVSSTIDEFLKGAETFKMTNSQFEREWLEKYALEWTDQFKRSARGTSEIKYSKLISKESIFKFRSNKFESLRLMIYNNGDEGNITKTKFNERIRKTVEELTRHIGKKPNFKPNAGAAGRNIYFWVHMPYLYRVEYSSSMVRKDKYSQLEFKPEYVRVIISQGSPKINAVNIDKVGNNILTQLELQEMITKKDDGSVLLEGIPMVDQGQKGYCACATTARILNYYGRDIDQHDIAKMALSTGDQGTDPDLLKKAIAKISSKLRLNMKIVAKCYITSNREYKRLWDKIIREFKKQDLPVRTIRGFYGNSYQVDKKDLSSVFEDMSLKDSRFKTFFKAVKASIDRGKPLAWALMLGIVNEPDIPQAQGGHMRLIIGYNEKTNEIYYSDSWGKGHEIKKMKAYNAYYPSMAVWEISPR